jgi:hypothetical protein
MNAVHIHLAVNHAPLFGVVIGAALLAAGLLRKSVDLQKASLWLLLMAGALTFPVSLSGERSHEVLGDLPGLSHSLIESHEEAAEAALAGGAVLVVAALWGLFLLRKGSPAADRLLKALVALALIEAGLLGRASNFGGWIRHPEVRLGGLDVPAEASHSHEEVP